MATAFFAGANDGPSFRTEARRSAIRLAPDHPDLGYHLLYSAAAFVLRDKRSPRDSAVIQEARRRKEMLP